MLKPRSPQSSFYGSYLYDRIVPQTGGASLLEWVTLLETKHYAEEWTWGKQWYGEYLSEFRMRWAATDDFWLARNTHSAEIRANSYADRIANRQPSFWDGPAGGYVNSAIRALRIAIGQ